MTDSQNGQLYKRDRGNKIREGKVIQKKMNKEKIITKARKREKKRNKWMEVAKNNGLFLVARPLRGGGG